jgi:hypothetical protein
MMVEAKEISHPGLARFGPGYQRAIRIDIMISSIIATQRGVHANYGTSQLRQKSGGVEQESSNEEARIRKILESFLTLNCQITKYEGQFRVIPKRSGVKTLPQLLIARG